LNANSPKRKSAAPRIREVVTSESDAVLKALTGKVSQEEQDQTVHGKVVVLIFQT
jgi:hypothetical protein